jgi:glycosyltransferase involved in cell wall biosynthesis
VTSNGGSLAEVAGNGAQVFNPMDVQGMADAVAKLLSDSGEREHWHCYGLARAASFSWQQAAQQTLAVYRSVVDRAPARELAARIASSETRSQDVA